MNSLYENLTNLYPVQKTLRFALIPVGKTRQYIDDKLIIESDAHLAESYQKIKKLIDKCHRNLITEALENNALSEVLLEEYYNLVFTGEDVSNIEEKLRKEVVDILTSHPNFKSLYGKDIVTVALPKVAETEEEYELIGEFARFSSYLNNYCNIKKNFYSAEASRSAVSNRTINENLPRYVRNMKVYNQICATEIDINSEIACLEPCLGDINLETMFHIFGFNDVLSQRGIDKYNQVIGGVSTESGKLKGLNEIINLYNQQHKTRLPKFTPLHKQIASESITKSFVLEEYENDEEIFAALEESFVQLHEMLYAKDTPSVSDTYYDLSQYDMTGIFVKSGEELNALSSKVYGKWNVFADCISDEYDDTYTGKKKPGTTAYETEKQKYQKSQKSYSLAKLQELSDAYLKDRINIAGNIEREIMSLTTDIKLKEGALRLAIDLHKKEKALKKNTVLVERIKAYLDSILALLRYISLLDGSNYELGRDESFYAAHQLIIGNFYYKGFVALYNRIRNYITKKDHSEDKIKLNFGNPTLLAGWDINKERDNLGILLQKDNKYFLGIMDTNCRKGFAETPEVKAGESVYQKMEYKLLPSPNKMLPHVFFSKSGLEKYKPSEEIMRIYKSGSFKKGDNFSLEDCHKLIDFYKTAIAQVPDWDVFEYNFSDTKEYRDTGDFFREVTDQGYSIRMKDIPENYVDELVSNGQLYLFQIYSKDFSDGSTGRLNLQSIYFKMLFDERNLAKPVYKLNGEAEVYFRRPSIEKEDMIVHKKGDILVTKNKSYETTEKTAQKDYIKDRRYTKEQFMLHVPVTCNFVSQNRTYVSGIVNEHIKNMDEFHILGIHRGERNLIYATVINNKGEIVDGQQFSLNVITNKTDGYRGGNQRVDYNRLLSEREKERDEARKNWQSVEQIKDLKTGYLSQAIHAITQLAIKYNAFIVIENLDMAFVKSRQKVEKQVYQNFESMLIKKLNLLVTEKDRELANVQCPGGALKAYQLTDPFESSAKLGNQSGILFRVPTWGISQTDPKTGFMSLIRPQYETVEKSKLFFDKFDSIRYNMEKGYFEFTLDYANFTPYAEGTKTNWTICTYGERIKVFRNPDKQKTWTEDTYYPSEVLRNLFEFYGIGYVQGNDLKADILAQKDAAFFKELMEVLKMTLQMKNTGLSCEEDYFQSCIMGSDGTFFNSAIANERLPRSTDANGAYNIARKGLVLIEKIKQTQEGEKAKLYVSNTEWLQFAQR